VTQAKTQLAEDMPKMNKNRLIRSVTGRCEDFYFLRIKLDAPVWLTFGAAHTLDAGHPKAWRPIHS
jgi:hypothetical protein